MNKKEKTEEIKVAHNLEEVRHILIQHFDNFSARVAATMGRKGINETTAWRAPAVGFYHHFSDWWNGRLPDYEKIVGESKMFQVLSDLDFLHYLEQITPLYLLPRVKEFFVKNRPIFVVADDRLVNLLHTESDIAYRKGGTNIIFIKKSAYDKIKTDEDMFGLAMHEALHFVVSATRNKNALRAN